MPKAPSILKLCKDPAKATVGKFYEFKNATDTSVDLYFYGDIVSDWWGAWQEEDQYPEAIKNFLAEAGGKDLNIYINQSALDSLGLTLPEAIQNNERLVNVE